MKIFFILENFINYQRKPGNQFKPVAQMASTGSVSHWACIHTGVQPPASSACLSLDMLISCTEYSYHLIQAWCSVPPTPQYLRPEVFQIKFFWNVCIYIMRYLGKETYS